MNSMLSSIWKVDFVKCELLTWKIKKKLTTFNLLK